MYPNWEPAESEKYHQIRKMISESICKKKTRINFNQYIIIIKSNTFAMYRAILRRPCARSNVSLLAPIVRPNFVRVTPFRGLGYSSVRYNDLKKDTPDSVNKNITNQPEDLIEGLASNKEDLNESIATQVQELGENVATQQQDSNNLIGNIQEGISDEEAQEWLDSIQELRKEFASNGHFLPEEALAPPGQARTSIWDSSSTIKDSIDMEFEGLNDRWKPRVPSYQETKEVLESLDDPVIRHITNLIMRDGKREKAQRILSRALYYLFCETRKDPKKLLHECLDSLAPLVTTKTFKTGTAKAATIPVPLSERQRHRMAWKWIMDGANKRVSSDISVRLGQELLAVYNGNSSGFEKRNQMHKTAVANRAYIKFK
ncbi:hypothetical protein TBLA_0F02730 [Henningerozyma blattae CBS 6284]|uniref:Small ribosomal subunit protein uS7m n=1 Tax=Henningerozyma blattae (strain ATCC 34711 / CBS 6284 / DSM 70876 / NBRC 10599 / NRRL Y-10934 / UCD 77-7) TaxID=1071380 RepID=I2H610_HENB6|nr:hypothetical protein TBLA_0F02730 [Tetrapisispora blattae CBS 6284]CCH61812.1 hypothetical protein TBLA_0F02730 [Tetrapisispora blattae CBS 6284]